MDTAERRGAHGPGTPARPGVHRRDVLTAAATAVVALALLLGAPVLAAEDPSTASLVSPAPFSGEWIVLALVLLLQAAAVALTRLIPRTVLVVVAALAAVPSAVVPTTLHSLGLLAVMVVVVVAVLTAPAVRLWPALTTAAILVAAGETTAGIAVNGSSPPAAAGQGLLQAAGVVGLPLLVALLIRSRRDVRRAQRDEQNALVRERDALIDAAVSRERTAMARELHDIAAHHLSGIALMAAVVDRQIDTDPARAHEGVRQMRAQSTSVLDDLRRLVGLLREDGLATRAVETLAGIADLVERARAHQAVDLRVLTAADRPLGSGIGPLAQLAAYRTVQEALSNAALHAPGAASTVEIDDRDPDRLVLRVENGAAGGGGGAGAGRTGDGGHGLRGMRERADLVGAELSAGPLPDGGWRVDLLLRRESAREGAGADGQDVA
ncbi:hypothetical protein GCM10011512_02300 [Tersicoccus solisilvae]|uniref:histidine kinase n=1 Tax=Tersicoccus solisilvae TaxID=1882339 RepID=A0ABQ1NN06_9MICC|nr:histidine kinase [Tersicoccus solisilvae]GGC79188.1 hypothetical protein GCM10011512_02300 [Tersicoccus solisilvae]